MPEQLPPETAALLARVERLARDVLVPLRDDTDLDPAERADRVRAASKDAGIYAMAQPAEFGGGATLLALTVVRDTLGAHNVCHLSGTFGPSPGVLGGVDEPLRSQYLAPLLGGRETRRVRLHRAGRCRTRHLGRPRWRHVDGERPEVVRHRRRERGLHQCPRGDRATRSGDGGD